MLYEVITHTHLNHMLHGLIDGVDADTVADKVRGILGVYNAFTQPGTDELGHRNNFV